VKKIILLFLLTYSINAFAQINPQAEQQARTIINQKGLDEAAVKARLEANGIFIEQMQPAELLQAQPRIEAILNEMEAEIKQKNSNPTTENTQPQKDSIPKPNTLLSKLKEAPKQKDTSEILYIYGHHLFTQRDPSLYKVSNEIKPTDTYILSSGDEITISVFGPSQFDSKYTISKDGYIAPIQMPKIFLKGLRLGQAKELLRSRFSNHYRFAPEQFAVSVSNIRNITAGIFGEAKQTGTFNMPAVNTIFNAILVAGGPTELGSVRKINIIRAGKTTYFDLYEFINNPTILFDFYLEDNDIVYIPVSERIVSITGSIRRPARYELLSKENLIEAIKYAGGLSNDAFNEVIQIRRFVNNEQILVDVPYKQLISENANFPLYDGDEIIIRKIPTPIRNTASIVGAIKLPGEYALSESKRVSDLVQKGGLLPEARLDIAFLSRMNADSSYKLIQLNLSEILAKPGAIQDLELRSNDILQIFNQAKYSEKYKFYVSGAVRDSIAYPYDPEASITIDEAILLAGGLLPEANGLGYIIRINPNNLKEKTYIPVNIKEAIDSPKSSSNVVLQPADELIVFSALTYSDESKVSIVGAVRKPGQFKYSPSLSVADLIVLSGGLKLEADRQKVDIYRIVIEDNKSIRTLAFELEIDKNYQILKATQSGESIPVDGKFMVAPCDEVVVRSVPSFNLQRFVEINGEVRYPGRYALLHDNETLVDLIQRAGGLNAAADPDASTIYRSFDGQGFVVTNLRRALQNRYSPENHILKPDDIITIPDAKALVTIFTTNTDAAEMYNASLLKTGQISTAYLAGKNAGWYIKSYAGGFGPKADKNRVTVLQPNGDINRTVNLGLFRIYPRVTKGSVIRIPTKKEKAKKEKGTDKKVDWDKALAQILSVGTLFALILTATR
jgi:protein involved in polysaccharide export with SLBB domain